MIFPQQFFGERNKRIDIEKLAGETTQQHIHNKLIEKAKERLSTTNLSVSEFAYELGFEHPQSFSKLFKTKTNQSPLEFRASFNEWMTKNILILF